jgi:GTP cyclohydrolase II
MNTTDSRILTPLASSNLPTVYGPFRIIAFDSGIEHLPHIVLENLKDDGSIANVRIHSECMTGDCGEQLKASLTYIEEHGGLLIYLRQEGRNIGLVNKLKAYHLQDQGMDTIQSNHALGFHTDQRTYEDALAILNYYKLGEINLLTNNPDKLQAFENSGIEVKNRIPVIIPSNPQNDGYLSVKKNTLGHLL